MEIPKQLKNPNFRFVLLGKGGTEKAKIPFEKDWQNKGYAFDNPKLINHIQTENNFGVIGGYGNLRILDIDEPKLAEEFEKKLDTYTIKTGSGGRHFYFISDYNTNHVLINELGELRANNYQVVSAPCKHQNGNYYEIVNEADIQEITREELFTLIQPYIRKESINKKTENNNKNEKDTSRSGLEYRKAIALFRAGKTRKEVNKELLAYKKFSDSSEDYKERTLNNAEEFILKEQEKNTIIIKRKFSPKELREVFNKIKKILKEFMDLREEYYDIVALWIIGTYFHKQFPSYPYLYFNAMKGSGKSRLLKIIANLSYKGKLLGSMTESVLFRTAKDRTLCIDEFEEVDSKDKANLRLLLNSAYKKGMIVERAIKRKGINGETYEIEGYEVYCPIALANVSGMENVLSDRCITIILEKSARTTITRLIENFENDSKFIEIKKTLEQIEVDNFEELYQKWNEYLLHSVTSGNSGNSGVSVNSVKSNNFSDTCDTTTMVKNIYKMINSTNLQGRDLELLFPLLIVSFWLKNDTLKKIVEISKEIVEFRRENDREDNKDVQLIEFIAQYSNKDFVNVSDITSDFRKYFEIEEKWLNSTWVGKSLRRNNLIIDKRRKGTARQVQLNLKKAQEKIKMFKEPENE